MLVGLTQDFGTALLVLAWIVGIHQLEAHVLNPKIMGDAARVHPVLVVFALLAGESAAGIVGALLAVPVLSITQTLFFYLRERFLGVPRTPSIAALEPPPPVPVDDCDPSVARGAHAQLGSRPLARRQRSAWTCRYERGARRAY